ncbi:MAG TPA: hypothetical protein VF469_33270 [Kofleriaceae bacterium]
MADRLNPGQSLQRGTANNQLRSANGVYTLVMQDDGNLVVYHGTRPLWATNTAGTDGQRAIMQTDGNFVLYHVNGSPLWASNTAGRPGSFVIMQNDGNLVIYQPNVPVWASNTAGQ